MDYILFAGDLAAAAFGLFLANREKDRGRKGAMLFSYALFFLAIITAAILFVRIINPRVV